MRQRYPSFCLLPGKQLKRATPKSLQASSVAICAHASQRTKQWVRQTS